MTKMRIGICDDERDVRDYIAEKIKCLYPTDTILFYPSGESLLAVDSLPDILFLDIQMPQIDGMETARRLRQKDKQLVIIFVTATAEHMLEAFDVRAFHYLIKPFANNKFAEVFQNARKQIVDRNETAYMMTLTPPCHPIIIFPKGLNSTIRQRPMTCFTSATGSSCTAIL